uniref:Major facilitator superfamily (MFS) profile domain-containing protein n=1 Tax=Marmota marmota marmota TaxID=9994 RepID=A0A8C5YUF9_MARMA
MAFQDLLDQVGGLGRFQIIQMAFLLIYNAMAQTHTLLENFTAVILGHRCWVHILDNATVSDNDTGTLSQEALLRISIPLDSNLRPDKCHRFIHPQWQLLHMNGTFSNMSEVDTEPCMDGWVYDRSSFLSTTVTEWDLVCESQSLNSVSKFFFMAGMLVGNIVYGTLSDRFGRRLLLTWCLLQLAVADTCATFAPTFLVYCSLRFLAGMSTSTILTNAILLIVEWTSPKYQAMGTTMAVCATSFGNILLGSLAFAIRNWHTLQLVLSIPMFFFFISSRYETQSGGCTGGRQGPSSSWSGLSTAPVGGWAPAGEPLGLFSRSQVCLLCRRRFAIVLPTFGLNLHLQHLGINVFLVQVLLGVVKLPANYLSLWALKHRGHRISIFFFMSMMGITLLATIFVPSEMSTVCMILTTLGGGICFASITCSLTQANELLPTVIRATAFGIIGVCGSLGAAVAPLLMTLETYAEPLPWIIYAASCIFTSLVVFLLPETRNHQLPDSLQDIENGGKGSRKTELEDPSIKVTHF